MARRGRKNFEPVSASQADPRVANLTVGDYANGVPNIRLSEMFKSLGKQMLWLIPIVIVGFFLFGYLTKDLKREYTGHGRVLVQLGEEYVYNPVGQTTNGNGLTTTIDTITLTEAALMKNDSIIEQVLGEATPNRQAQDIFNKDAFAKIRNANNERDRQDAVMELRRFVADNYVVIPRAKSSIIDVVFKHEDPDTAVSTTNLFIDAYLNFRREVFVEGSSELITERREATEGQLMANERELARFLKRNDIADFESEREGLQERTEDLKASLNETRATIAATEAELALVEDQLRSIPETIDIFRDDRVLQRVSQAELELRQLLAKYLPSSDPVRQKQAELDELRSLQASTGGKASGGRRVGPNPTHQELTTRRNTLAATADAMREREFTQQRQLNSADSKIRKLTSLNPEYLNLLRERETLNERLTSYNAKEQESLIDSAQAEAEAENVKVISRAEYANKGQNTRLVMWLLGTVGWSIVFGFFALIRVFLDPKLYVEAASTRPQQPTVMPNVNAVVTSPMVDPIPEPIPSYDPVVPDYPNPYEAGAAAQPHEPPQGYGYEAAPYMPAGQVNTPVPGYSPTTGYDQSAYVQFDSSGDVHPMQGTQAQMSAAPQFTGYPETPAAGGMQVGQADMNPYGAPAYDANAALDLSQNPYLTGNVQAGALENVQPQGQIQYDEYGRPIPPVHT